MKKKLINQKFSMILTSVKQFTILASLFGSHVSFSSTYSVNSDSTILICIAKKNGNNFVVSGISNDAEGSVSSALEILSKKSDEVEVKEECLSNIIFDSKDFKYDYKFRDLFVELEEERSIYFKLTSLIPSDKNSRVLYSENNIYYWQVSPETQKEFLHLFIKWNKTLMNINDGLDEFLSSLDSSKADLSQFDYTNRLMSYSNNSDEKSYLKVGIYMGIYFVNEDLIKRTLESSHNFDLKNFELNYSNISNIKSKLAKYKTKLVPQKTFYIPSISVIANPMSFDGNLYKID